MNLQLGQAFVIVNLLASYCAAVIPHFFSVVLKNNEISIGFSISKFSPSDLALIHI